MAAVLANDMEPLGLAAPPDGFEWNYGFFLFFVGNIGGIFGGI